MKCFQVSLLVLLPLIQYATAVSIPDALLFSRQLQNNRKGGVHGNGGSGNIAGGNNTSSVSSTSTAIKSIATNTTTATNTTAVNNTAAGGSTSSGNPQTSLTLDPSVIGSAFAKGQGVNPGEANSLQSTNNFINFCVGKTITNGQQVQAGSCNPVGMGDIPSTANMPSAKFQFPANGGTVTPNTDFTIKMAIGGMETGQFTNAQASYFAAPQQLNAQGQIIGHSHVVVELLSALDQTTLTNPTKFAFFKGLNAAAVGGVLTADVTGGLPAGFYKLSSINTAANHQPCLVPIAQHGSLDDAIYFTVGNAGGNSTAVNAGGVSSSSSAPPAASSPAASKPVVSSSVVSSSSVAPPAVSSSSAASPAVSSAAGGGRGGGRGGRGHKRRLFLADY